MATARSVKVQPATNRSLKGRLGGEKIILLIWQNQKKPKSASNFSRQCHHLTFILSFVSTKRDTVYFSGGLLRWELGAVVVSGERVNRVESKMPGALKVSEMSKK